MIRATREAMIGKLLKNSIFLSQLKWINKALGSSTRRTTLGLACYVPKVPIMHAAWSACDQLGKDGVEKNTVEIVETLSNF